MSEINGNSEVSSSEVNETSSQETGGEASEATQEAAKEQAEQTGGFEDKATEDSMKEGEEPDEEDSDEDEGNNQEVGFDDSDDVDDTEDTPDGDETEETEPKKESDVDSVGFDDEDQLDEEDKDTKETEETDGKTDPTEEKNDKTETSERDEATEDEDPDDDLDDQEEEDPGEIEDYTEDDDSKEKTEQNDKTEDNDPDEEPEIEDEPEDNKESREKSTENNDLDEEPGVEEEPEDENETTEKILEDEDPDEEPEVEEEPEDKNETPEEQVEDIIEDDENPDEELEEEEDPGEQEEYSDDNTEDSGENDEDSDNENKENKENSDDDNENEDEPEKKSEEPDNEAEDNDNTEDSDDDEDGDPLDIYEDEEDPGDVEEYEEEKEELEKEKENEEAVEQVENQSIDNNVEENMDNEAEISEDENKNVVEDTTDPVENAQVDQVADVTDDYEMDAYDKAMADMTKYMSEHNYGPYDYPIYSKDPEWKELNTKLETATQEQAYEKRIAEATEYIKNEKEGFLTNDGEKITYKEAVDRVTGKAEEYLKAQNVPDEKISEIKADIEQSLYKQEIESRSRGLGDHGIRHIYGNFERSESYLKSRGDTVTPEQKLGVLVAQTYHDEGYGLKDGKVSNKGVLHGGSDKKHDEASLDVWNGKKDMYSGVFSEKTMASIDKAIGEHNIGNDSKLKLNEETGIYEKVGKYGKGEVPDEKQDGRNKIKENTSVNSDVIVSTVHACDKLALSEREKFSHTLLQDNNLVKATEGMNSINNTLKDEKFGVYDSDGKLTAKGEKLLGDYHDQLNEYIDKKYSGEEAAAMKSAVDKDIGLNSGHFSSKMNYIYTPSNCYQYDPDTNCNKINVYRVDHENENLKDLQDGQLKKMFEDFGLTDGEIDKAIADNKYEDKERGLIIEVKTMSPEKIKETEAQRYQENTDLIDVNESIDAGRGAYSELNETVKDTFKDKAITDISYKDYDTLCSACDTTAACSEEDWNLFDADSRAAMVTDAFTEGVLNNMDNILKGGWKK